MEKITSYTSLSYFNEICLKKLKNFELEQEDERYINPKFFSLLLNYISLKERIT